MIGRQVDGWQKVGRDRQIDDRQMMDGWMKARQVDRQSFILSTAMAQLQFSNSSIYQFCLVLEVSLGQLNLDYVIYDQLQKCIGRINRGDNCRQVIGSSLKRSCNDKTWPVKAHMIPRESQNIRSLYAAIERPSGCLHSASRSPSSFASEFCDLKGPHFVRIVCSFLQVFQTPCLLWASFPIFFNFAKHERLL